MFSEHLFPKNTSGGLLLYIASLYSIEEISTSLQHSNTAERWEKTVTCEYLFIELLRFFKKIVQKISKNYRIKTTFNENASWKFENLNRRKCTWVFSDISRTAILWTHIKVWFRVRDGVDVSCTEFPNVLD